MCELLQEKSMDPWGRRSHKDPNEETEVESGESIVRRYIVIKKKQILVEQAGMHGRVPGNLTLDSYADRCQ